MENWLSLGFKVEHTEDESPTLRMIKPCREDFSDGESMHHSGGAWKETRYIYLPVIDWVRARGIKNPRFLSLGLGLGYVEMMLASEIESLFKIFSFEVVPELKDFLIRWACGKSLPREIELVYDQVAAHVLKDKELSVEDLKMRLKTLLKEERWILLGALEDSFGEAQPCHGIMYDAFSKNVSPQLWSPEFLSRFLQNWTAPECCLSTYSCTGNLKRSLIAENFRLVIRPGFQGKRDSTWAERLEI